MKVIIAGSRQLGEQFKEQLFKQIEELPWEITEVVSGGAEGIDSLGEEWARLNNIPIKKFLPEWSKYGRGAGYRRNIKMAEYADACFVFWNGVSNGSHHMMEISRGMEIPTIVGRPI